VLILTTAALLSPFHFLNECKGMAVLCDNGWQRQTEFKLKTALN